MKTEFVKWGNSLALRIPKAFAHEVGAAAGKLAEMSVESGVLVVKVAKTERRRRYVLENLTNEITRENSHSGEIEWGAARGNEVW